MSRARLLPRFAIFALVVLLALGALTARLFYLQVAKGGYYGGLADENRVVLQPIPSSRGLIVDRAGRTLVTNVPSFAVKVRPADLPLTRRPSVVARLSTLLGLEPAEINELLDRNAGSRFDLVRIAGDVPAEVARVVSEEHLALPGVEVVVEARRQYPFGPLVSQVLGYTGSVDAEDLERLRDSGYLSDDEIGRTGVEAIYEQYLRGVYGTEQVERDASGRKIRVLATVREPQSGASLELSLDMKTQRQAENSLRWAMDLAGLKRGVVIVMNPQTGEVLALVSLPSYDNNLFSGGISNAEYRRLLTDRDRPLVNHAVSDQFPPGSTYKLVTGTGGLSERVISAETPLVTRPYLSLGRYRFWEWNRRGWGPLDIYDGFGHSSDTYFFQVAGRLGIDRLAKWAKEYGFAQRTGIDLPAEARGTVPSSAWKEEVFGQPIYPGEVYQAGIGQGYDTVTPIQLITAYSALANGGKLYQPQVVRRILAPDGSVVRDFEPKLTRQMKVDPDVLRTMRLAARRVVTIRHTYNLVELPLIVAGKSGTAEFGLRDSKGRLPFHSWFVAFVPRQRDPSRYDDRKAVSRTDSELAVLAFAYDSRTKGNVATEIVKYFLQQHYGIKRDYRNFDLVKRANFYGGN
ncbi:MAG TPA: penicillin-binding protein 2 [Candidatus Limnocylindrales bacterium]|nr:penicillin-binding protein 2 [Candidatus Limnocylindrales bacterium]